MKVSQFVQRRDLKAGILALSLIASIPAFAKIAPVKEYTIDSSHSSIEFTATHMMISKVKGTFKEFSGDFAFGPDNIEASRAKVEIKVASIDTNDAKRDQHLKSPDFFDVEKYPTITFVSKSAKSAGLKRYKLVGELTMHGVTKEVTFDVDYGGTIQDPWGNNRIAFQAKTKINRKDFNMVWNKNLDKGGVALGNEIEINFSIEGIEKKAEGAK